MFPSSNWHSKKGGSQQKKQKEERVHIGKRFGDGQVGQDHYSRPVWKWRQRWVIFKLLFVRKVHFWVSLQQKITNDYQLVCACQRLAQSKSGATREQELSVCQLKDIYWYSLSQFVLTHCDLIYSPQIIIIIQESVISASFLTRSSVITHLSFTYLPALVSRYDAPCILPLPRWFIL